MGAWGFGLFQSDHDLDIVSELTDEAGIYELKKQNAKNKKAKKANDTKTKKEAGAKAIGMTTVNNAVFIGTQTLKDKDDDDDDEEYESIYNPQDLELVRNHLDSGVLVKMLEEYETKMLSDDEVEFLREPGYIFMILGACAMTCGCTIPKTYKSTMQKVVSCVDLPADAIQQTKKALNGPNGFKDGEPYDFNSPGLIETMNAPRSPYAQPNQLGAFGMNVHGPGTMFYQPPKGSTKGLEELKAAKANEVKYAGNVCGGCGATEKIGGGALFACGRCGGSRYCSRECQKRQWHFHQRVCGVEASGKENEKK